MGFPRGVRDQVMVAAARHCCACHRYKGVKVEVHHIKPESSGGANTFENAIALCFDCHADAGHYNPKQPRGTKFSPSELAKARDNWFAMVQEHNVQEYAEPDSFYCRYYVCKNYENLIEITKNDLSRFPAENPLLVNNSVIETLKKIISYHKHDYRRASALGDSFPSLEKYFEKYPAAQIPDNSDGRCSYFETTRVPSLEELIKKGEEEDGLVKLLLEENVSIDEICIVGGYRDECGGVPLQEEFMFRQLWCSFLAISNLKDMPVTLDSIEGQIVNGNIHLYKTLKVTAENLESISLPKAPVPPKGTVLIPLALILPPLYRTKIDTWSQDFDDRSHVQEVSHCGISSEDLDHFSIVGNQILPVAVEFKVSGQLGRQELHELDLSNMYAIDRFWEMGSCPHLFFVGENLSYSREILAKCELIEGVDSITVPERIHKLIIAELEGETTEIESIKIDGELTLENITLQKHDLVEIDVLCGMVIEVIGKYIPDSISSNRAPSGLRRNEKVCEFLASHSETLPNNSMHRTKLCSGLAST